MIRSDKTTGFDVIPVPTGSISSSRSQDGKAEITVSVPHCHDEPAQYYVVKRPVSVDETAFKIALDAAFRAVSGVSQLASHGKSPFSGDKMATAEQTRQPVTINNTAKLEQLRKHILADSEWLPAQEVSRRAGSSATVKNPSGLPNRWKRTGKIFALSFEGRDLYPAYGLDVGGQPLPLMKKIIALFGGSKTPWTLAVWFGTPNSWLGNEKPKNLMTSQPEKVLEAAQRSKEGPVHG
ncbi:hypothetical protein SAMN05428971_0591 [Candidatus Pantoea varia]|uniref:DUF2384 domain-containing protein n=2 Tax=Candidatus Pantoea varia TaxID=1881036 RepID=A0A1I4X8U0_9GAMM|nr:hypothetical protein SAMN05428971_0591 [Pantoea varia]